VTVRQTVTTAMLAAAAFLLMATIQVPILPQAPFLKYDPSDAVALLGGLTYGPSAGAAIVLIKDVLFLLFRAGSPFGPLADFIAASTFVVAAAWVYRHRSGSFPRRLLEAALFGATVRVLVMIPTNFVILYLEFGMSPARVAGMLLPAIMPFNALKALINAVIALAIVEPFHRYALPNIPSEGSR
jgi:riboflavin transporter FmnP